MYQSMSNPKPRMTRQILRARALRAAPMRVIDGGARGGAEPHWNVYGDQLELIAFEPDKEECRRLTAAANSGPDRIRFICEPMALAGANGHSTLNLARYPPSSSLLPDNCALTRRFAMAEDFERVGTATVETTNIESLMTRRGFDYLDFMKLDVEGAELDVLHGARRALEHSLLGLSVEVWFQEDHVGRPLFNDIDAYLRDFGFALFDVRELNRWRRSTLNYLSRWGGGQLMYGNALYFRDLPARLGAGDGLSLPSIAVMKLASLAELFCYPDFSVEVLASAERAGLVTSAESQPWIAELRRNAAGTTGDWRAVARQAVRSAIPSTTRVRLRRIVERLTAG